jgi:hypothetical protein
MNLVTQTAYYAVPRFLSTRAPLALGRNCECTPFSTKAFKKRWIALKIVFLGERSLCDCLFILSSIQVPSHYEEFQTVERTFMVRMHATRISSHALNHLGSQKIQLRSEDARMELV